MNQELSVLNKFIELIQLQKKDFNEKFKTTSNIFILLNKKLIKFTKFQKQSEKKTKKMDGCFLKIQKKINKLDLKIKEFRKIADKKSSKSKGEKNIKNKENLSLNKVAKKLASHSANVDCYVDLTEPDSIKKR